MNKQVDCTQPSSLKMILKKFMILGSTIGRWLLGKLLKILVYHIKYYTIVCKMNNIDCHFLTHMSPIWYKKIFNKRKWRILDHPRYIQIYRLVISVLSDGGKVLRGRCFGPFKKYKMLRERILWAGYISVGE